MPHTIKYNKYKYNFRSLLIMKETDEHLATQSKVLKSLSHKHTRTRTHTHFCTSL